LILPKAVVEEDQVELEDHVAEEWYWAESASWLVTINHVASTVQQE
jgi:hypothetical protein